jgi:hypothetical protein
MFRTTVRFLFVSLVIASTFILGISWERKVLQPRLRAAATAKARADMAKRLSIEAKKPCPPCEAKKKSQTPPGQPVKPAVSQGEGKVILTSSTGACQSGGGDVTGFLKVGMPGFGAGYNYPTIRADFKCTPMPLSQPADCPWVLAWVVQKWNTTTDWYDITVAAGCASDTIGCGYGSSTIIGADIANPGGVIGGDWGMGGGFYQVTAALYAGCSDCVEFGETGGEGARILDSVLFSFATDGYGNPILNP